MRVGETCTVRVVRKETCTARVGRIGRKLHREGWENFAYRGLGEPCIARVGRKETCSARVGRNLHRAVENRFEGGVERGLRALALVSAETRMRVRGLGRKEQLAQ